MNAQQTKKFCRSILHVNEMPVKIPGSSMFALASTISPKMAADWIEKTNTKNRNCRQSRVRQFSSDISDGLWILTHQAIAFDENGELISGQHRLEAVVLSGEKITQLIILNCSTKERATVDQTLSRNVRDVASLAHGDAISGKLVGTARSMAYGRDLRQAVPMTPQQVYGFIARHREALDFVLSKISRHVSGVTTATVLGPICRAFYYINQKGLSHFIHVLCEGFSLSGRDKPIILLRNWLMEHQDGIKNFKGRQRAYGYTSFALMGYKMKDNVEKLQDSKKELFELPEAYENEE